MISIKTPEEISIMAEGGKILAEIMKELEKKVEPGIATKDLDRLAESLVLKSGGKCSFKSYKDSDGSSVRPYPTCLCTSINEEIVHATPSDRILKEGDIISLDLGIFFPAPETSFRYGAGAGFHSDMAVTLPVGKILPETERLIKVTEESLKKGIKEAKIGNTFGDIGNAIQKCVEDQGFNVVKELCGHGIGRELHEDPQILNYGERGSGPEILQGMVFCLEPMVTIGDWRIKKTKDGFGYKTRDNSLSAHFEHTVAVTKDVYRILTELR